LLFRAIEQLACKASRVGELNISGPPPSGARTSSLPVLLDFVDEAIREIVDELSNN
jgi:hypothetical protein